MWFITVSNCFHKTRHWSHWTHHSPISLCFLHTHFLTGYLWHAQSLRCQKEDGWIHRGWMDGSVNRWLISLVLIAASVVEKSSWCCLTIKCPEARRGAVSHPGCSHSSGGKTFYKKNSLTLSVKDKNLQTHTHTHTHVHTYITALCSQASLSSFLPLILLWQGQCHYKRLKPAKAVVASLCQLPWWKCEDV